MKRKRDMESGMENKKGRFHREQEANAVLAFFNQFPKGTGCAQSLILFRYS